MAHLSISNKFQVTYITRLNKLFILATKLPKFCFYENCYVLSFIIAVTLTCSILICIPDVLTCYSFCVRVILDCNKLEKFIRTSANNVLKVVDVTKKMRGR